MGGFEHKEPVKTGERFEHRLESSRSIGGVVVDEAKTPEARYLRKDS